MPNSFFWDSKKIRIFCGLVLGALFLHIAWVYLGDTSRSSLLKRGDFPSFYSAGMIVRQHLTDQLYDTKLLAYVQNLYWPSLRGNYISFPYPPFVALGLSLFAYAPPALAKILFTLVMMGALILALKGMRSHAPCLKVSPLILTTFFLGFFPVSFGVLGSQFTALNMMLYAGLLIGISQNSKKGDVLAGLALGFWFFKPQYALFFFLFLMIARKWRVIGVSTAVLGFYFVLGVLMQGGRWPFLWLHAAASAARIDFAYNHFNMVSLSGFFYSLHQILGGGKFLGKAFNGIGVFSSLCLLGWLGSLFLKIRRSSMVRQAHHHQSLVLLLELTAPVLMLSSPHALFYDLGILVMACARHLSFDSDRKITALMLLTLIASLLSAFKNQLPFQPLIFYVVAACFFLGKKTLRIFSNESRIQPFS